MKQITGYPFEETVDAVGWLRSAAISEADRLRIGRTNAIEVFRLA